MSATVEFFEQDFIVGQYECDCNGRMKAGALMAQSQAISTNHCNELGLTIDVYRRTHTVFLLAKASLEIYHDIKVGDKLRVVTRPSGPKRAIYNRYTSFINEQGIEVAAQDSKWVLVDTDTRKILRDPPEDLDFPFRIQEIPEQDLSIPKVRDAQQTAVEPAVFRDGGAQAEKAGHQLSQRGQDGRGAGDPVQGAWGERRHRAGNGGILRHRQEGRRQKVL